MSQDEMSFGEVTYREPERRKRPDRDRRWACVAYEVPQPADLPIFLDRATADAIERHALRDTSVELGGILLGKECVDEETGLPFVWVTNALEARHYENTQASFTYTHDSWEEISREREAKHPDLDIVGWYHTHPNFGIFLSGHDLFIHQHFFAQPLQVAYVVDPIRQTRGFFHWRDGQMAEVGGFHLTADRADRLAVARLAHQLEKFPQSEGGGGGFSPRLEAELIAMLARPSTRHLADTGDRTSTAALFALLGAFAGVLGLAGVLWLNQIHSTIASQARSITEMEAIVRASADRQRVVFDAVAGRSPDDFREQYARTAKALDEARARLSTQETVNDALAARNAALTSDLKDTTAALETANALATRYETDAKDATRLRPQVDRLIAENKAAADKLAEAEAILDTEEGQAASSWKGQYDRAKLVALGGWGVSALLALAMVTTYARLRSPAAESEAPGPEERPTHRID